MSLMNYAMTKLVRVTRQSTQGTYVDGYWSGGKEKTFEIRASVQPITGRELEMLPGGDMEKEAIKLYFNEISFSGAEKCLLVGDRVEVSGKKYVVQSVQDWGSYMTLTHWKAMATLDGQGGGKVT